MITMQIAPDPTPLLLSGDYIPLPTMLSNIPVSGFHFVWHNRIHTRCYTLILFSCETQEDQRNTSPS
jgi:hypothetical protein